MNSPAFQAAFVKLVTDREFREAIRNGQFPDDLDDEDERSSLAALAAAPGIAAMRVVHRSFRLNKVLALLPLTGRVLGEQRLSDELERYWKDTPSASFYYFEEAGRFCAYLEDRFERGELEGALLRDALIYEGACIRLRHAASEARRLVLEADFEHHPAVLADLAAGQIDVDAVVPCPTTAWGIAQETGDVHWYVRNADGDAAPGEAT